MRVYRIQTEQVDRVLASVWDIAQVGQSLVGNLRITY